MKKTILTLTALFLTVTSQAAEIKFVALDDSKETQVCMAAAESGISGAKQKAKDIGMSYKIFKAENLCNGKKLKSFVKQINASKLEEIKTPVTIASVKFTNGDQKEETTACINAAKKGFTFADRNYKGHASTIVCNGLDIRTFAKKYKNKNVL